MGVCGVKGPGSELPPQPWASQATLRCGQDTVTLLVVEMRGKGALPPEPHTSTAQENSLQFR